MVDAFDIAVGGTLGGGANGPQAQFNQALKGRVKGDQVAYVLEQLLLFYKTNRKASESFHDFVLRVGVPAFQEQLSQILEAGIAS
ncbi:hypothetical protein HMSSN139_61740 [Paenibacillus sp. HMSSN-139]|nr:hypothetical protein HMSSN139_61740 [Paenibacillus sp. HMSSN-139]